MIETSRRVRASADAVWAVLSDGWVYPSWVVGASRMRAVDAGWPGVGAKLHHSAGVWPLLVSDSTSVLESVPRERLVLQARGWPLGEARIDVRIAEEGADACVVTIFEDATHGPAVVLPAPVRQALLGSRNRESLQRLAFLAERHTAPTEGGDAGQEGDDSHLHRRPGA